jgi:hypothetical protein
MMMSYSSVLDFSFKLAYMLAYSRVLLPYTRSPPSRWSPFAETAERKPLGVMFEVMRVNQLSVAVQFY